MLLRKAAALFGFAMSVALPPQAQRLPPGVGAQDVKLYARLMAMTDSRQLDMPPVERSLASKWRILRAAATMAIGQVGAEGGMAGAARLRVLLEDREPT